MRAAQFLAVIGRGSKGSNALENTEDRAGATSEQQDNVINTVNSLDPYGPSWQLVPGNVSNLTVYAQVPTNGTGDAAFSRASVATRTNSAGTIVDVASGMPRIHYRNGDGSLSSTGRLLGEAQRTNSALYSEQFDNAYWSKLGTTTPTVTANATTSPDGTVDAELFTGTGGTGQRLQRSYVLSLSTAYSVSVFVKANTATTATINVYDGSTDRSVTLTFSSGAITTNGTGITGAVMNLGNGWFRLVANFASFATTAVNVQFLVTGSTSYYIWGAQLEAGTEASTYIRTTTAAVTRVAENTVKSSISNLIGQTEGTILIEVLMNNLSNKALFAIDTGATTNFIRAIVLNTNAVRYSVRVNNVDTNLGTSSVLALGRNKIALAYKSGDWALYVNGVQASTSATTLFPVGTLSQFSFTSAVFGYTTDYLNQAAIIKRRLTNAELAAITTL